LSLKEQGDNLQVAQSKNNGEKKTVLFLDDQQIVLDVGSLMLHKLVYNVLAVSNGIFLFHFFSFFRGASTGPPLFMYAKAISKNADI
jgi:hypothetical protein